MEPFFQRTEFAPFAGAKSVIILGRHALICEAVQCLLKQMEGFRPDGYACGLDHARRLIRHTGPDLALVDVNLGKNDVLEAVRNWPSEFPGLRVFVLVGADEWWTGRECVAAGAAGLVSKACHPEEMNRILSAGQKTNGRLPSGNTALTSREMEVIRHIAAGRPTRQIAAIMGISVKTVERFRENIKNKWQISSGAELVREAILRFGTDRPIPGPVEFPEVTRSAKGAAA